MSLKPNDILLVIIEFETAYGEFEQLAVELEHTNRRTLEHYNFEVISIFKVITIFSIWSRGQP